MYPDEFQMLLFFLTVHQILSIVLYKSQSSKEGLFAKIREGGFHRPDYEIFRGNDNSDSFPNKRMTSV